VLEFRFGDRGVDDYRYRLLPVFSNLLPADPEMQRYIDTVRAPYLDILNEELAVAGELLYRRGNFNGTFDQLICDGQRAVGDAQISLFPGFRWGTSVLLGQPIEAGKSYKVAGWATAGSQAPGRPIWEVVADYLRDQKTASVSSLTKTGTTRPDHRNRNRCPRGSPRRYCS
jgi:2',3'-cyclic-nucleotide 2'-phosphodiesterase (5'-nucleotidase family)